MNRILWHGTNEKKTKSILLNGFKKRTWFASHLEDALEFGGNYVFAVVVNINKSKWQVCISNKVPVSSILWLEHIKIKRTHVNKKLYKDFFSEDYLKEL